MMQYSISDIEDNIFSDESIISSGIHLSIIGENDTTFQKLGLYTWIEGGIHNFSEIIELFKYSSRSFAELLIDASIDNRLENVLSKIDGCFTAILYDKNELKLISDRYGMKSLYLWNDGYHFAWVSELKALLALECFNPEINTQAIECFMDLGYFIGNMTWFNNVKLINAASIITYSLRERKIIEEKRYWKWSKIKPIDISFNKAVVILGNLLQNAVKKRVKKGENLGISLSGGLDSRMILAAINQIDDLSVKCFTFGKRGCLDIEIAKKVSSINKNYHKIFELNENNWMNERLHQIWRSDGMKTLLHLHSPLSNEQIKKLFDINITGQFGECVKGDWINKYDKRIDKATALELYKFGKHIKSTDLNDDFYDIFHQDPYIIDTRGRRFIGAFYGVESVSEIRRPLLDNDLMEFLYTLPDIYRKEKKIYEKALLYKYPEYFEKIPWNFTGYPISKKMTIHRKIIFNIKKILKNFQITNTNRKFSNYPDWLRNVDVIKFCLRILDPKNALYSNYINENFIENYLKPHCYKMNLINRFYNLVTFILNSIKLYVLNHIHSSNKYLSDTIGNFTPTPKQNKDYSNIILRALTMEIWFQQVFNKKYRSSKDK